MNNRESGISGTGHARSVQPSATPPVFDTPAFLRFSQNCEPLIVVEIFGKIVKRQVCQKRGELPTAGSVGLFFEIFVWGLNGSIA